MNVNSYELYKQRSKQFEREAQQERLAQEVRSAHQPTNPVLNAVLAAVGEQLVELGSRLQERNERNERNAQLSKIEAR